MNKIILLINKFGLWYFCACLTLALSFGAFWGFAILVSQIPPLTSP